MSTRKLIALAMGCALVILLAGGIQLLLLSKRDTVTVTALAAGQSTAVGDTRVTVLSTTIADGTVRVATALEGPGDLAAVAKDRFAVRARERALAVVTARSSCQSAGEKTQCDLVFDAGTTSLTDAVVVYRGAKASWSLAAS